MQKNKTKQILLAIKVLVIILLLAFLYNKFSYFRKSFVDTVNIDFIRADFFDLQFLIPLLFATIFNWLTESIKWYYLLAKKSKVKFSEAVISVLCGLSVSVIMPNRSGEFLGRIFYLKNKDKVSLSILSFYTSYTQQIITIAGGLLAFYCWEKNPFKDNLAIQIVTPLICALYLSLFLVVDKFEKFRFLKNIFEKLNFYKAPMLSVKDFTVMVLLSLLRYLIFTLQLFYVTKQMGVQMSAPDLLSGIALVYFINSFVPSYFVTEIASRSLVAMIVFDFTGDNGAVMIIPVFIIWVVNIALPALLGLVGILKINPGTVKVD